METLISQISQLKFVLRFWTEIYTYGITEWKSSTDLFHGMGHPVKRDLAIKSVNIRANITSNYVAVTKTAFAFR